MNIRQTCIVVGLLGLLAACGQNLDGVYKDDLGLQKYEFQGNGTVYVSTMGVTREANYVVEDKKVKITNDGETIIYDLNEDGTINQYKLDLVARAGGSLYSRAREGFFEIPKPISTLGIGVDAIPLEIRNSSILTGNDLGMLANVEAVPSEADVDKFAKEHSEYIGINTVKKHTFAKALLEKNEVSSAWKVLLMQ